MKRFLLLALSCMLIMAALATFLPKVARASGAGNSLFGVAAVSDDDVWATGQFIPSAGPVQALIEHWNGHTWQVVSNPTPAGGIQFSQLHGLAAISKDDIWAVGGFTTGGGNGQTLTEHWNGAHWKIVPSPTPVGATDSSLLGVAAVSHQDVWAVGETRASNGFSGTLIEHWNGHTWQIVSSPNPAGSTCNSLNGVAAVPHDEDVWAVGNAFGTNGATLTLIEAWNGSSWRSVPSPTP